MTALAADPNFRPVESESPRWPGPKELMALVHELFREGSLDHAQMKVLSTLPELSASPLDAKPVLFPSAILPAE
jgi:hypothetical protein